MLLEYHQAGAVMPPWGACPGLHHPLGEGPSNAQPNPPLALLPAIPSGPGVGLQRGEKRPAPAPSPPLGRELQSAMRAALGLLQAEKTKLLHLLLIQLPL